MDKIGTQHSLQFVPNNYLMIRYLVWGMLISVKVPSDQASASVAASSLASSQLMDYIDLYLCHSDQAAAAVAAALLAMTL